MKKRMKQSGSRIRAAVAAPAPTGWTFLTNHTHVLVCLFRNPEATLREVAALVGITERMVQKIVAELVAAGFLEVTRVGRRNTYEIATQLTLRHPLEAHCRIGDILKHLS